MTTNTDNPEQTELKPCPVIAYPIRVEPEPGYEDVACILDANSVLVAAMMHPEHAHEVVTIMNSRVSASPAAQVETGGFTCDCCRRNVEVRINGKFCNECAGYRSGAAPAQSVANLEAWASIDQWLRENPAATGAECLAELVKRIKVEAPAAPVVEPKPIDVVLFCPRCGTQHVDAAEDETSFRHRMEAFGLVAEPRDSFPTRWTNPPHKSHLCHQCGAVWRPADVPTNGVTRIRTRGERDNTWTNSVAVPAAASTASTQEDAHPEDFCHKCGRPNISWFAPNELWNKAVRAAGEPEILCPVCFVALVEALGTFDISHTWEVAPKNFH